jgi:hypothetical protein
MVQIPVNLAVEDQLSEAVLRKILHYSKRPYVVGTCYNRGGFGYLKKTIAGFNNAAKGTPFIVLTDLDAAECPPSLIRDWLPRRKHPNLVFRVAVREVESWLLADGNGLSKYLLIRKELIPQDVDTLSDPKQTLVNLARKSRYREIKNAIVPRMYSTAKQGPDYNGKLLPFVSNNWNVTNAMKNSISLKKGFLSRICG